MADRLIARFPMVRRSLSRAAHYQARFRQEVARHTGLAVSRPTEAIILLTHHCNARCLHCHSWKLPPPERHLTPNEWIKILDELRAWLGPVFVSITGGEALLMPGAIDIAAHGTRIGLDISFLSNGFPITPDVAARLVASGVGCVTISIDGSNAEIHNLFRGRRVFFERVIPALESLVAERTRQRSKMEIWLKTVISSVNYDQLVEIAELAAQLGVTGVKYQPIEPTYYSVELENDDWFQTSDLWPDDTASITARLNDLKTAKSRGLPILNSFDELDSFIEYFGAPELLTRQIQSHDVHKRSNACPSWIGDLQILPDGGMKMCHWMEPFANAADGNLKQAWADRARCWKSDCAYL